MGAFLGPEYSNINIEQTLKEIGLILNLKSRGTFKLYS